MSKLSYKKNNANKKNNKKKVLVKSKKHNYELILLLSGLALIIIGVAIGGAYAFFNYTRTGDVNVVKTGYIDFQFDDGNAAIEKGNAFPISTADIDNTINKSFTLTSHTTYSEGIKYRVYVVYGDAISGKSRLTDDSITFQFIPPADGDGFSTIINNYSSPSSLTFSDGKALVATGLIKNTSALTTKSYTAKLWIDSNKMYVSSTTKRGTNAEGNPSLADTTSGTTTASRYMTNDNTTLSTITLYPADEEQEGKIIYTNNDFSHSYYSFKILIEAEEETPPICKRAQAGTLHTETCNHTGGTEYCYADGYYSDGSKNTTTITYGTLGTTGQRPQTGDAFDCDVNGDGEYNPTNERFYYVSDYFDTDAEDFDDNYAALIYYRNYVNGSPGDGGVAYYSGVDENWHGPTAAIASLPSNKSNGGTWRNDLIKTQDRKILSCNDVACTSLSTSTAGGTITYTSPIYSSKAARLLTIREFYIGCSSLGMTPSLDIGSIEAGCNFVFEETKYADWNKTTYGPWFENANSGLTQYSWVLMSNERRFKSGSTTSTSRYARPVIDIPYSRIAY